MEKRYMRISTKDYSISETDKKNEFVFYRNDLTDFKEDLNVLVGRAINLYCILQRYLCKDSINIPQVRKIYIEDNREIRLTAVENDEPLN